MMIMNEVTDVLAREFQIEDDMEAGTVEMLASGELGKRIPQQYSAVSAMMATLLEASCSWGCRNKDHFEENLVRRLINACLGVLRLSRLGLYEEGLGLLRNAAEIGNLIEVFVIRPEAKDEWMSLCERDRYRSSSPAKVRIAIENAGYEIVTDEKVYSALCDLGVHIAPSSIGRSHHAHGRSYVGGVFSFQALC